MAQQQSIEIKVGIFVVVCLAIGAWMIWNFGKFRPGAQRRYPLVVMFDNVGGLIVDANVMYAGVAVGKVREIRLVEDHRLRARVLLAINEGVVIREDARFVINQAGLLGDRYVDVIPRSATAPPLAPGAEVEGSPSVDLTEAIRSVVDVLHQAAGTIGRVDQIVQRVDGAVRRVDETVLSTQSLQHVANTFAHVDAVATNAVVLATELRQMLAGSRTQLEAALAKLDAAAGNFGEGSKRLSTAAERVDTILAENRDEIRHVITNIVASTETLTMILARLEKGEGTAGKLLADPTLHDELVRLIQNWRRHGLLYKEGVSRRPATEPDARGMTPVPKRPATVP